MLEFAEEPLDEISLAVDRRIDGTLNFAVFLCRDMRTAAMCRHHVDNGSCVIAAIGDERPGWRQTVDQGFDGGFVGGLASGEHDTQRQTILIDQGVDFGA